MRNPETVYNCIKRVQGGRITFRSLMSQIPNWPEREIYAAVKKHKEDGRVESFIVNGRTFLRALPLVVYDAVKKSLEDMQ